MLIKNTKYSYQDVSIVPARVSDISSRKECYPLDENGYFPLFTAPMSSVVDENTVDNFEKNHIYSILPRTVEWEKRFEYGKKTKRWIAVSLSEFQNKFIEQKINEEWFGMRVLIDIANGHMKELFDMVKVAKTRYGKDNLIVMIGNIANPETYHEVVKCGADMVRCSIGTGNGCTTSSNVSIHYPIASLLDEIKQIKNGYEPNKKLPKIIADGGIRNYSDVIKALALGADYVMVGSVFSSLLGSAGDIFDKSMQEDSLDKSKVKYVGSSQFRLDVGQGNEVMIHPVKLFYGMASRRGQKDMKCAELKTSEGVEKIIPMINDISGWIENFDSYLRSAMSYTNARNLKDFQNNTKLILISQGTINAVNK